MSKDLRRLALIGVSFDGVAGGVDLSEHDVEWLLGHRVLLSLAAGCHLLG